MQAITAPANAHAKAVRTICMFSSAIWCQMPQDKADNLQPGSQIPCQLRFAAIKANAVVADAAGRDPIFIEKVN